jgi:hypothetical protein
MVRRFALVMRRNRLIAAAAAIGVVVVGGTAIAIAEGRGSGPSQASATQASTASDSTASSPLPTPTPPTPAGASATPAASTPGSVQPVGTAGPHVLVIVEENTSYEEVIGSPSARYITALAQQYASATQWYAVTHGSIQNYIAATSGQIPPTTQITNECTPGNGACSTSAPTLVDQLEAKGLTWKAYQEDMPTPCFKAYSSGHYVARHNPFIYYSQIRDNPARCNRIVPFTQFAADLAANALPSFAWVTPNLCNDMHNACPGGRIENADRWLEQRLPPVLGSGWFQQGGVIVITWDEGNVDDTSGCCGGGVGGHVPTLVLGNQTTGFEWSQPGDHYGLLRGLEEVFGLPFLGAAASKVHGDLSAVM